MFNRSGECRHKFEARYDSRIPEGLSMKTFNSDILEAVKIRTYVKDICVKCGKEIKRV